MWLFKIILRSLNHPDKQWSWEKKPTQLKFELYSIFYYNVIFSPYFWKKILFLFPFHFITFFFKTQTRGRIFSDFRVTNQWYWCHEVSLWYFLSFISYKYMLFLFLSEFPAVHLDLLYLYSHVHCLHHPQRVHEEMAIHTICKDMKCLIKHIGNVDI